MNDFGSSAGLASLAPDPLIKNVPPHSREAERALLSALLIDPTAMDEVAQVLPDTDSFYLPGHRLVYETIVDLWTRDQPADVVLVHEELERKGVIAQVGGIEALADLASVVPTGYNAEYYAKIVRDRAMQRRLIEITAEVQRDAFDTAGPVDELLDRAEQRMFEVTQKRIRNEAVNVGIVVKEAYEELLTKEQGGEVRGLPSYYADLDDLTSGFLPGEMTVIAARPSMGKTSFALNVIRNIALHGGSVCFFSLEMPRIQVTSNMLCGIAKIDGHRLRTGLLTREEKRNFVQACDILEPTQFFIDDSPTLSTMELRAKGRRLRAQHNIEMLVIDYLQLMSGSSRAARESRQMEVTEISRNVKALARELEIPIICLAQLSRKVEDRSDKKPMMSDLRESGCLTGDSLVTLADSGRRVPIRELEGRADFDVWAMNPETLKLERGRVSHAFCTGTKPVFRLTTKLGRTIRATANHRFFTLDGWKRLDELGEGTCLAIPRALECATGEASMSSAHLALLGHGRGRALRVAEAVDSEDLKYLAESDLYWDPVVSIEPAGEEPVYDLTVPGPHCFVADDILVHNSIEQDADKIMLLHRPEYYDRDNEELKNKAFVIVAKNRNGPTGEVEMIFMKNQMRFETATVH
ncbi:MAG: replicative DNA helicase [Planctomycetota bacterium]